MYSCYGTDIGMIIVFYTLQQNFIQNIKTKNGMIVIESNSIYYKY